MVDCGNPGVRRLPLGTLPSHLAPSIRSLASRVARQAAGRGMGVARSLGGLPGFATGAMDVNELERTLAPNDTSVVIHRWHSTEPARTLEVLPGSDETCSLEGVDTTVSLVDVRDRRYSLRGSYLIDPRRRVVYETRLVPSMRFHRISIAPLESVEHVDGVVACLCQAPSYGHWNLMALPLIRYYRELLGGDPDFYYCGSRVSPWQLESLEMLGIDRSRILKHGVTADRLLVAIADRRQGYDESFLLFADENLLPKPAVTHANRRILVSRASASMRRLVNEEECARALGSYGFEVVTTEALSLLEEIELFRQAEVVLGVMGAGLTNAIFAPAGTPLISLAASTWESQIEQIAAVKQHPFALIHGPAAGPRVGIPELAHDFSIDVGRVVRVVEAALERAARSKDEVATVG